jgi:hypothetical protein
MMGQGYGPGHGMMGGMMPVRVTNLSRSILHEIIVVAVENSNVPLPYDYNTVRPHSALKYRPPAPQTFAPLAPSR